MDKEENAKWAGLFLLLLIPATILRGFAMHKCWEWFVIPAFGFRHLGIVEALGISLTLEAFIPRSVSTKIKFKKSAYYMVAVPLIILGYGYIYKCLM
jgi:hypothetical protein